MAGGLASLSCWPQYVPAERVNRKKLSEAIPRKRMACFSINTSCQRFLDQRHILIDDFHRPVVGGVQLVVRIDTEQVVDSLAQTGDFVLLVLDVGRLCVGGA